MSGPVVSVPVPLPGAMVPLIETGPDQLPLPVKVAVLVISSGESLVSVPVRLRVPALICVGPVKLADPEISSSPAPVFVRPSVPERAPASVVVPAEILMVVLLPNVSGVLRTVEVAELCRSMPVAVSAMVLPATVYPEDVKSRE